jgi:hypothetical protein
MNKLEAQRILGEELARFAGQRHAELAPLVKAKHIEVSEVQGASGAMYQIEIQFLWDDRPGGTIRAMGGIDDGGLRAFFPLTDCVIIQGPDG